MSLVQGDFLHWLDLFNHFDDILRAGVEHARRSLYVLSAEEEAERAGRATAPPTPVPLPDGSALELLRVTAVVLEKCTNKHVYSSVDSLTALLASPSPEVAAAALRVLALVARRGQPGVPRGYRLQASEDLTHRLFVLAQGYGGMGYGGEDKVKRGLTKETP